MCNELLWFTCLLLQLTVTSTQTQFSESWQKENQGMKSHNQLRGLPPHLALTFYMSYNKALSFWISETKLTAFIIGNGFASPGLTDFPALLAQQGCLDPCFRPLSTLSKCCAASSTRESSWPTCHVITRGFCRCPGLKIPKVTRPGWPCRAREASGHPLWLGKLWTGGPTLHFIWWLICTDMLFQSQPFCRIAAAFPGAGKSRTDKWDSKCTLRTLLQNSQVLRAHCENLKVSC